MTFKEYLIKRKAGYDALGDFVRLARVDTNMPDVSTWSELRSYIEGGGNYSMVGSGLEAWSAYQSKMKERAPDPVEVPM